MKTTIVTTTISVPTFLTAYEANARRFGHEVDFIVVGDKKTPLEAAAFCESIPNCTYLDLKKQEKIMTPFPALWSHIPLNSIERRNIGMLEAYKNGADV